MPTITLTPNKDTYVSQASPSTPYGSQSTMLIRMDNDASGNYSNRNRSYVAFDLSSIPDDAYIKLATLSLYVQSSTGTYGTSLVIRTNVSFTESSTYNSISDASAVSVGGPGAINIGYVGFINYKFGAEGFMKGINFKSRFAQGFELLFNFMAANSSQTLTLQTREGTNKPTLTIEYYQPPAMELLPTNRNRVDSQLPTAVNFTFAGISTTRHALARFVFSVPSNHAISFLRVWLTNCSANEVLINFMKTTSDWEPATVTWNTKPVAATIYTKSGIENIGPNAYYAVDISDVANSLYSNGVFLLYLSGSFTFSDIFIEYQTSPAPPSPPQPLYPFFNTADRASIIRFQWQQTFLAAESQIIYNDGTDKSVNITTSDTFYDMPINTLPEKQISWKVRSRDPNTTWTDFSQNITFISGSKAATPSIITSSIQIGNPIITWTAVGQVKYRLKLKQGLDVIEQIETQSQTTSYIIKTLLDNSTSYTIELEVAGANGLWSNMATRSVTSNFLLPTNPAWFLTENGSQAQISITSGANSSYHQVLKLIDGKYEVIADNVPINANLTIRELQSGKLETLKLRTFRASGGYLDTLTKTVTVKVMHCLIYNGEDIEVECALSPERAARIDNKSESMYFAGREKPVILTGEHTQVSFDYSFEFVDNDKVAELETMVREKRKVLIRDNRGRLSWTIIGGVERRDSNLTTLIKLINVYEVQR